MRDVTRVAAAGIACSLSSRHAHDHVRRSPPPPLQLALVVVVVAGHSRDIYSGGRPLPAAARAAFSHILHFLPFNSGSCFPSLPTTTLTAAAAVALFSSSSFGRWPAHGRWKKGKGMSAITVREGENCGGAELSGLRHSGGGAAAYIHVCLIPRS